MDENSNVLFWVFTSCPPQTLASWTNGSEVVLKHAVTLSLPMVEGYFHPSGRVSLFFSYSIGETRGPSDKMNTNITAKFGLDPTPVVTQILFSHSYLGQHVFPSFFPPFQNKILNLDLENTNTFLQTSKTL